MKKDTQPHVLAIVGSPRRKGNTEILVDEVLRGAEEAGASVEKVILSKLQIAPCNACDKCQESGECIYRDDMVELFLKMQRSSVWVLGTPVYWWGPTAQFKLFLDRWYAKTFLPQDLAIFRNRRVILVIPMGDDDTRTARHTVGTLTDSLDYVGAKLVTTVLAPGVNDRGEVQRRPDLLAAARRAGRETIAR